MVTQPTTNSFLSAIPAKIKTLPFLLRLFLCLISGMLIAAALAPVYFTIGALIGFSLFYLLLSTFSARAAITAGWLFGFGYHAIGLYWIGNALLVEGNDYAWAWPLAVAGLPALLAFFTAAGAYAFQRFAKADHISGFILFIAIFSAAEYLRGTLFTGFPWNLYGYIWGDNIAIMQFASFGGVYGLSLLTIFWCSCIGFLLLSSMKALKAVAFLCITFVSFSALSFLGSARIANQPNTYHEDITLKVVQPNIAQKDKWDPNQANGIFNHFLKLSKTDASSPEDQKTVIIWPETATRSYIVDHPDYKEALHNALPSNGYLLTGYLNRKTKDDDVTFNNSLAVFNNDVELLDIYHKSHLVPFGEYIPFQKWIPLAPVTRFKGFQSGNGPQTLTSDLPPFSPLICYEIIFPSHVTNSQNKPQWIVNVTNDGWYGQSSGPYQHLVQTRFRAIEEGIPVVRSANTGISAVIDGYGRTLQSLPLEKQGVITSQLPLPIAGNTIFSQCGNWLFLTALLSLLLLCIFGHKKRAA